MKWLRWHHRSSANNTDYEAMRTPVEKAQPPTRKQKQKRDKATSQRESRAHSDSSTLHTMRSRIALGGATQFELAASAAVAAEEEQQRSRRNMTKSRRRYTIHGIRHDEDDDTEWSGNSTPAGSPSPMFASTSPSHFQRSRSRQFGLVSKKKTHGWSPRAEQMTPQTPEPHPSIIFIDCPP
ncbi:hypothetical protein BBJ28_00025457 [Nothophytophthora sp. Chile5]|nr:hypothetical protein BBJ28_00025457 [Nothophytophthora sp. Chile5]